MYHQMITDVITDTFNEKVGKWQFKKEAPFQALKVTFRTKIDYDKEDGYRFIDILVYGPLAYVGVYVRERWTILANEDISDEVDDYGENVIKPGKDYQTGETAWKQIAYHDSGWRSAISAFLFENRANITGFDREGASFYKVIDVPAEIADKP